LSVALLAVVVLMVGYINVRHYVDWQNNPKTRVTRYLYVTAREFPEWTEEVIDRIKANRYIINVGMWRDMHPISNIANPYGVTP
jgi:hypothetical protein